MNFDWPSFILVPGFDTLWHRLGWEDRDHADHALALLQHSILKNPTKGTVVPGMNGWRKIRCGLDGRNAGKSGALRVYYAMLVRHGLIVLGTVFSKNDMKDLNKSQKNVLATMLVELTRHLEEKR